MNRANLVLGTDGPTTLSESAASFTPKALPERESVSAAVAAQMERTCSVMLGSDAPSFETDYGSTMIGTMRA